MDFKELIMKKIFLIVLALMMSSICFAGGPPSIPNTSGIADFIIVEHTSGTSLSDSECTGYMHTNQGASGTIQFTLPTVTATSGPVMFENQEAQKIEIKPQTGEIIIRDSTTQTASYEVDINAAPGMMICYGSKNASGTAVWRCDSDGSAVDGGAAD